MTTPEGLIRRHAARLVALATILTLYSFARQPQLSGIEQARLAAPNFDFERHLLPELPGATLSAARSRAGVPPGQPGRHLAGAEPHVPADLSRTVRPVHPSLKLIESWISSVGAAVALNDLDGDGLPNDVVYVDTRTDRVILAPVPGTGERFEPFSLDAVSLPYDPETMAPMGCLPGDLNEDGLMDILVYHWGRAPIAFLRRPPDRSGLRRASFVCREVAPEGGRWFTNAAALADLDGDGHTDLVIGNYFPDEARILDARAGGIEAMQHSMSRAGNGGRKHVLRWIGGTGGPEPTVGFADAGEVLDDLGGYSWTLAIGAADLDGDLLPEIYFANDFGPDRLMHNRSRPGELRFALLEGRKTLTSPSSKVLGRDSFKGMGVDFGDLNGDGILDIFVSNIAAEYALEESHFAFLGTGELGRMRQGIRAPPSTRANRSGCRAARGAGTRSSPTSTMTGSSKSCRRTASSGEPSTVGPSCKSLPWATTSSCTIQVTGRDSGRVTTCAAIGRTCSRCAAGASDTGTSPQTWAWSNRGSAGASPWPTLTAMERSTLQSPTSGHNRRSTGTRAWRSGNFSVCICCCRSTATRSSRPVPGRVIRVAISEDGPPSGLPPW